MQGSDGNRHFTYKDGLPSSSIRSIVEDDEGNIFVGSVRGVFYFDNELKLHILDDDRINIKQIVRLTKGPDGKIYGNTHPGDVFCIENKTVSSYYTNNELGLMRVNTIFADPDNAGKVYIGTEIDKIYYGDFGDGYDELKEKLCSRS